MKNTMRKGYVLEDRVSVEISLPESFLESIFTGFSIMKEGKEDLCVRYSMGSEEKKSFLPFYDHRPAVIEAAKFFDRDPSPMNALALVKALRQNAELEVKKRAVKREEFFYVNYWPTDDRWPEAALFGRETDLNPDELERGLSLSGTDALWYWFGIVPLEFAADTRKGLKIVHLWLEKKRG